MHLSNPDESKPSGNPSGTPRRNPQHYQNVEAIAVRAKQAMNPRLRLAPAAEALTWMAPQRPKLGGIESGVVDIIVSWTLGRGEKWKAIDAIALSQMTDAVFALTGKAQTESQRIMVTRAVKSLLKKGLIRRIRGGQKGAHRSDFFYPVVIVEILQRVHQHHDDDLGREDADEVLAALDQAEADGERIWAGHVTGKHPAACSHVTGSSYVSGNTAPLPLHVTAPNYSLSRGTLKRDSQGGVPLTSPPWPADRSDGDGRTSESGDGSARRLDAIQSAKQKLPWSRQTTSVGDRVA